MSKTVVISDLHGHDSWKRVLDREKEFDKVVFMGDYVDSFNIHVSKQVGNLREIIQFRKDNPDTVTLQLGNHDLNYWQGYTQTCSGYQSAHAAQDETIYEPNRQYL